MRPTLADLEPICKDIQKVWYTHHLSKKNYPPLPYPVAIADNTIRFFNPGRHHGRELAFITPVGPVADDGVAEIGDGGRGTDGESPFVLEEPNPTQLCSM